MVCPRKSVTVFQRKFVENCSNSVLVSKLKFTHFSIVKFSYGLYFASMDSFILIYECNSGLFKKEIQHIRTILFTGRLTHRIFLDPSPVTCERKKETE